MNDELIERTARKYCQFVYNTEDERCRVLYDAILEYESLRGLTVAINAAQQAVPARESLSVSDEKAIPAVAAPIAQDAAPHASLICPYSAVICYNPRGECKQGHCRRQLPRAALAAPSSLPGDPQKFPHPTNPFTYCVSQTNYDALRAAAEQLERERDEADSALRDISAARQAECRTLRNAAVMADERAESAEAALREAQKDAGRYRFYVARLFSHTKNWPDEFRDAQNANELEDAIDRAIDAQGEK